MSDNCSIRLISEEFCSSCGFSLASSLYQVPLDILLSGPLGAGKTTFLKGFLAGLGVDQHITSPTYALEQRYNAENVAIGGSRRDVEILHCDLYRLSEKDANTLVDSSNDFKGIRCIEWADKLTQKTGRPTISFTLEEDVSRKHERILTVSFQDVSLPDTDSITQWRSIVHLQQHICNHCDAVASIAYELAEHLLKQGVLVRKEALRRAGMLHDLFRFVDFRVGGHALNGSESEEDRTVWKHWESQYPDLRHEPTCATFLREQGFPELSDIVETHGYSQTEAERNTVEQKLLFYADKRACNDVRVTIDERFADFAKRYTGGEHTKRHATMKEQALAIERELFPNGAPL